MEEAVISKQAIVPWLSGLLESNREIIGVKRYQHRYRFEPIKDPHEAVLDYDVTLQSPKKFIFPPIESLLTFQRDSSWEPVSSETKERIIFGIHPYDLHAFSLLDDVFNDGEKDPHYLEKRRHTFFVGVDVMRPSPHAFCTSMGTATVTDGFDVMLTSIDNGYFVRVGTQSGRKILPDKFLSSPTDAQRAQFHQEQEKALVRFALNQIEIPVMQLPGMLEKAIDHPIWQELDQRCLGCGSCNLVCPTCYCFDVKDDLTLDLSGGVRQRVWDGCLLKDFSRVASGEVFRETRAHRNKHRFFRKGKYMIEKYHKPGCVGCGRCTIHCLADINPVEVFNAMQTKEMR